jgi:hypothetical protein
VRRHPNGEWGPCGCHRCWRAKAARLPTTFLWLLLAAILWPASPRVPPGRQRRLDMSWRSIGSAIVAALAHPPILGDCPTVLLSLDVSRSFVSGICSLTPETRRTEEFRVLSKGLEYAVSVVVAAAPVEGFALLRELASIDDRDVRRIVRSNLGKSRLSRPHPTQVA